MEKTMMQGVPAHFGYIPNLSKSSLAILRNWYIKIENG